MLLSVVHATTYRYAATVSRSTQVIRLTPHSGATQRTIEWQVELPGPATELVDAFGNRTHLLALDRPHDEIRLVARGRVEVADIDDGEPADRINPKVFLRATRLTEPDDPLRAFVEPMRGVVRSRPLIGVSDLMSAVLERVDYRRGVTTVDTTAAQAFAAGAGVCQDLAQVFVTCCRLLGVPARYVSGYAFLPHQERVESHAWAEAWLATRWVAFDPSHGGAADGARIRLAVGLDYLDACPVRGVRLGGGEESLTTAACVRRGAL